MVHSLTEEPDDDASTYVLFKLSGQSVKPLTINVHFNGARLRMEVDTGACV